MAEVRGVNLLQNELERAKEGLKDVDENIRKLTGRDPTIQRVQRRVSLGSSEPRGGKQSGPGSDRIFNLARRGIVQDEPGPRRRGGGAFSRLGPRGGGRDRRGRRQDSGDEEDSRPAIQSSVIATPKEERSRQVSIEEQSKDRKGQARNRRMFGLLLGTLQKFKDESKETKEKEEQRIKIEKKLDEKFKQEKEDIIKERRLLFHERRKKQFRIRLIEQKMEMVQNHDNWAVETRKLENFLRTKARPHIFYMPRIATQDFDAKLKDSKTAVDAMIENRRKKLELEIDDMMSQVQDVADEDGDDGDASMGEDEERASDEGASEGEGKREPENREGKENRERHRSGVKGEEEGLASERELRDKEREQRDRDRQMKDLRHDERKKVREEKGTDEKDGRNVRRRDSEKRDRSREQKDNRKDKDRETSKHRGRSRSASVDQGRVKHRSGRDRSRSERSQDRKRSRHHSEGDKSHGQNVKSKRRSKGDGKSDKREKVWEPMEDEEEEEFMGTRENEGEGNIQSKMLEMAGMASTIIVQKNEGEEKEAIDHMPSDYLENRGIVKIGDIPAPMENERDSNQGEGLQGQDADDG